VKNIDFESRSEIIDLTKVPAQTCRAGKKLKHFVHFNSASLILLVGETSTTPFMSVWGLSVGIDYR